jgi:hypothetical protein
VRSDEREGARGEHPHGMAPWERRTVSGNRNLVLGTLLLFGAVGLLGQAIYLAGASAAVPIGAALLAVVTLFILSRARLLRQRNGGFLALGIVCVMAAALPLVLHPWRAHDVGTDSLAGRPSGEPSTPPRDENTTHPLLTQSFKVPPVAEGKQAFKVLRDFHVEMGDGKVYLIKSGETLPLAERAEGEVRFLADEQKIGLPQDMVEMVGAESPAPQPPSSIASSQATPMPGTPMPANPDAVPAPGEALQDPATETPAQRTARSQKEAIRRYPGIGQKGSPENQLFVETFQELKHSGADDFFADPEWPLQLAELLAKRESWQRAE